MLELLSMFGTGYFFAHKEICRNVCILIVMDLKIFLQADYFVNKTHTTLVICYLGILLIG